LSGHDVAEINGVQIGPGTTALTRTPEEPSCCASAWVKATDAALVIA